MKTIPLTEYEVLTKDAQVLAADPRGDQVLRLAGGEFAKLFRRKRRASSAAWSPYASRFAAAARELLEETGYRAAQVVPIGTTNPNPALFGNRLHSYLGLDVERVAEIRNDASEETVVELVSQAELRRIVRAGGVDHALVLAALQLLDLHREGGP